MIPLPVPGAVAVRFDEAAAVRLVQALEALADELDRLRRATEARLPAVTTDWLGCSRRWFDERHLSLADDLLRAAAAARTDAEAVQHAAVRATALQQHRNEAAQRAEATRLHAEAVDRWLRAAS